MNHRRPQSDKKISRILTFKYGYIEISYKGTNCDDDDGIVFNHICAVKKTEEEEEEKKS